MFNSRALYAMVGWIALASTVTAQPHDPAKRDDPYPVRLTVPDWTWVQSPDKSDTVKGWGGRGWNYWIYNFGGDYTTEKFSVVTYKHEGNWTGGDTEPTEYTKDKTLECKIEVNLADQPRGANLTLVSNEPWFEGDPVKSATCTVK